jgi:ribosomal protein L11 methyltransferase
MPWLQVTLTTERGTAPLIEAALHSAGALAVTLEDAGDQPELEPPTGASPLWPTVRVTALFDQEAGTRCRAEGLASLLSPRLAAPPAFEQVADRCWERVWMDAFTPTRFGRRLWICPRGQRARAPDGVVVTLDPGLAFGTGHHPTTALCLRWLDAAPLDRAVLVDYGCGSGILAIAALKLGAARAVAVDHDPQALEATVVNAAENRVADRLLVCAPGDCPETGVDLLVANILAAPLVELAARFAGLVRPGGSLALSGVLRDQADAVWRAYSPHFELSRVQTDDGWALLDGRRRCAGPTTLVEAPSRPGPG